MLQGININERITFTSSEDTDPKTEIIIRPLSGFEMMNLSVLFQGGKFCSIILKSVVEIKNPDISEKEEVEKYISSLSVEILTVLMESITSINNVSDDEAKN